MCNIIVTLVHIYRPSLWFRLLLLLLLFFLIWYSFKFSFVLFLFGDYMNITLHLYGGNKMIYFKDLKEIKRNIHFNKVLPVITITTN